MSCLKYIEKSFATIGCCNSSSKISLNLIIKETQLKISTILCLPSRLITTFYVGKLETSILQLSITLRLTKL